MHTGSLVFSSLTVSATAELTCAAISNKQAVVTVSYVSVSIVSDAICFTVLQQNC
jgi:hypothetical protein